MSSILVFTNVPDLETAQSIVSELLRKKLAACVNVGSPIISHYSWEGKLTENTEIPICIKTQADCYPVLESAIKLLHPYSLPEIIAIPIYTGLPAYLDWIKTTTVAP